MNSLIKTVQLPVHFHIINIFILFSLSDKTRKCQGSRIKEKQAYIRLNKALDDANKQLDILLRWTILFDFK